MSRHDVVKRHDFRSAMKSKEKLSSMNSVRFDGIYNGKEAEVGHDIHIYILFIFILVRCLYSTLIAALTKFWRLCDCVGFGADCRDVAQTGPATAVFAVMGNRAAQHIGGWHEVRPCQSVAAAQDGERPGAKRSISAPSKGCSRVKRIQHAK